MPASVLENQRPGRAEAAQVQHVEARRADETPGVLRAERGPEGGEQRELVTDGDVTGAGEFGDRKGCDRNSGIQVGARNARAGDNDELVGRSRNFVAGRSRFLGVEGGRCEGCRRGANKQERTHESFPFYDW